MNLIRCDWDENKSKAKKKSVGIGFDEAMEIFKGRYVEDVKNDEPFQFRAIGFVNDRLFTLVYEVREDDEGEYYHLISLWKATKAEIKEFNKYEKNKK